MKVLRYIYYLYLFTSPIWFIQCRNQSKPTNGTKNLKIESNSKVDFVVFWDEFVLAINERDINKLRSIISLEDQQGFASIAHFQLGNNCDTTGFYEQVVFYEQIRLTDSNLANQFDTIFINSFINSINEIRTQDIKNSVKEQIIHNQNSSFILITIYPKITLDCKLEMVWPIRLIFKGINNNGFILVGIS